jgi:hypothetical protein
MSRFRLRKQRKNIYNKIISYHILRSEKERRKSLDDFVFGLSDEDRSLLFSSFAFHDGMTVEGARKCFERQKAYRVQERERIDREWSKRERFKKTLNLVLICMGISLAILFIWGGIKG